MSIMGTRHVISAGHYLATHAGFEVLEAGGNAIDAGVAAGIAIGVLQTEKVNFGGVAPQIIYTAKDRKVHCIDGLGVWPRAVTPDYFMKKHAGKIPPGVERCVVPAAPDAWITALAKFGTMSFGEVAASAIRFASEGFPMYPLMSEFIKGNLDNYSRWPSTRKVFLPRGRAPEVGELFVQSDLGRTLQYMVDEERKAARRKGRRAGLKAARDAFYKGDIAQAVTKWVAKEGGLMRYEDFAGFKVNFEPTVQTRYGDITLHACGPWSQGPVLPMALNILKGYDLKAMGHNSADYIHVDVMDGHFVPNLTIGPLIVEAIRPITSLPLDVHLMIEAPERHVGDFARAGADIITVQWEACPHLHRVIQAIKGLGVKAGVALNPATPVLGLVDILPDVDLVLIMSVNPGFGGQTFIPNTIRKLHALGQMLREQGASCEVEVDGGINAQTASPVVAAGAEVLVAGSAVFNKKASVAQNIAALRRSSLGLVQSGVKEAAGDT
ncbi:ribulose-phosphate 3-epimerase [Devosia sp.]|uniref:ribulose-phosphate 3-epimerase n=1 Tax=Devosia sp. TaxID=1871048 RepID=UPI002FCBC5E5